MFGQPSAADGHAVEPDLSQARRTALKAHSVVIKLKEMGLPEDLDDELATLSTDLGDLWGAQKALDQTLEGMLNSPGDWEAIADHLVDLRTTIDHIKWHAKSAHTPLGKIVEYAYLSAASSDGEAR
jgi:hypothetical protein